MGHIQRIKLNNYRSFMEAECRLSPLTLVVGRNNTGKTNFLRSFQSHAQWCRLSENVSAGDPFENSAHYQTRVIKEDPVMPSVELEWNSGPVITASHSVLDLEGVNFRQALHIPEIYSFDPVLVGGAEPAESASGVIPRILPDGKNVTSVLRMLKLGNQSMRKRFDTIESQWQRCVPEIKTLHLAPTGPSRLMVEQHTIPGSQPLSDLSDGTRLILAVLALVHQENPPPLILLEDLDHRIHPRLFESIFRFLRDLVRSGAVSQIIATTHNPYLVDEFIEEPEAVVIVEKYNGCSTLANMDERLARFLERDEELEMPLGQVLFSGLADAPPPARVKVAAKS